MQLLFALLLVRPEWILIELDGAEDAAFIEVRVLEGDMVRKIVRVPKGRRTVKVEGLRPGRYDVWAKAPGFASALTRGLPTVRNHSRDTPHILRLQRVVLVKVRTTPGATILARGLRFSPEELKLPPGLHAIVVQHPERVSSPPIAVRVKDKGASLDVPLDPGRVLTGRVLDSDGDPAPGARVDLFADGRRLRTTTTDDEGRFAFSGFLGEVVSVEARALYHAVALRRVLFFPNQARASVTINLSVGAFLSVGARVVPRPEKPLSVKIAPFEPRGRQPLPRAEAVLLPAWYEEAADRSGIVPNHVPERRSGSSRFFFTGVVPERRYRVLMTRPESGVVSTTEFRAPPAGRTLALSSLILEDGASIEGSHEPGVTIVLTSASGTRRTARTDHEGRFFFGGLAPGEYVLFARNVDERGEAVQVKRGEWVTHRFEHDLPAELALSGTVLDADGKPLSGIEVEALGRSTITGPDGEFRFDGRPHVRRSFPVLFRPTAQSRGLLEDPHLPDLQRARIGGTLKVVLKRAGTLRLKLESGKGRLGRVRVDYWDARDRRRIHDFPPGTRDIAILDVAVGSCRVRVHVEGRLGVAETLVPVKAEAGEVSVLTVEKGRSVSGRVVLRQVVPRPGKRPIIRDVAARRAWVVLVSDTSVSTPVEEDGSFFLSGLPEGPVTLAAAAPGRAPRIVQVPSGRAGDVEIVLGERVWAEVRVMDPAGNPVRGARVRIVDEYGLDVLRLALAVRFRRVVAGDEDLPDLVRLLTPLERAPGRYRAGYLNIASYTFRIGKEGYKPAKARVRALGAAALADLEGSTPGIKIDVAVPVRLEPAATD
ncbi:MAG: carboxypeptidase regulatory-like domain-containing protein [Planctomycetota bacterium]|nr:carboxypeptidase regulatory-like domain-containing protein [Planctomycetota bacterium]